jgi:hypothetical protein
VRRLLALSVLLALVPVGTAFANHFDPERKIKPADEARARAMLLRRADLEAGYRATTSGSSGHLNCAPLDESDLTLTGDAESPTWSDGLVVLASFANVYASAADADASWRRSTSSAGRRCVATEFQRLAGAGGGRLLSLRQVPFPRVAPRTVAYRIIFEIQSQGPRLTIDLIALQRSRAQAYFIVATVIGVPSKADEVRLARTVAGRMAKAMRGAS